MGLLQRFHQGNCFSHANSGSYLFLFHLVSLSCTFVMYCLIPLSGVCTLCCEVLSPLQLIDQGGTSTSSCCLLKYNIIWVSLNLFAPSSAPFLFPHLNKNACNLQTRCQATALVKNLDQGKVDAHLDREHITQ